MPFVKATTFSPKLRLALSGPPGSGKTYTALKIATAMKCKAIAVIDTENASAAKYRHDFNFDVGVLEAFSPLAYVAEIEEAEKAGYDIIIIDSLSHAWDGEGGALEMADKAAKRYKTSFQAWGDVTPLHRQLIKAITGCKAHVIATMRSKTEYAVEQQPGKKIQVRKLGLAPIQRQGTEYEFDIVGEMDQDNTIVITKSRCSPLHGQVISKPGVEIAEALTTWLASAGPVAPVPAPIEPDGAPEPEDEGLGLSESTKAAMTGEDAPAEAPAQNGRGRMNPLVCQVCHEDIKPVRLDDGRIVGRQAISERTTKDHGRPLCYECAAEVKRGGDPAAAPEEPNEIPYF